MFPTIKYAGRESIPLPTKKMPTHILYLTLDGILEPLGYSQIVRVLTSLTGNQLRYTLVSLEKPENLRRATECDSMRSHLKSHGIEWVPRPYQSGSRGAGVNFANLSREVLRRGRSTSLVHARSYLPGAAALLAKKTVGTPYVFDTRGFWIDEKRDAGRWFKSEFSYGLGKAVERELFLNAAAIVSLTKIGADDVRCGVFGKVHPSVPVETITTLTDFEAFATDDGSLPSSSTHLNLLKKLRDVPVLGYVGSLNPSYDIRTSMYLAREILETSDRFHFLGLTSQVPQFLEAADAAGVPLERTHALGVSHSDVPVWLQAIDWGLLILNTTFAKRASMPTKLGEFFAAGIRPIQFGCNSEVSEWVQRVGTGIVIPDTSVATLKQTAHLIVEGSLELSSLESGRTNAEDHFSLQQGRVSYRKLLQRLTGSAI